MKPLLEVKDLRKYFPVKGGFFQRTVASVHAVDDVSFSIKEEETFGVVGESGCGKTTLGKSVLRIIEPDAGEIYFEGKSLLGLKGKELRKIRCSMQMVFQDPQLSLDPRMTVEKIVREPLVVNPVAKHEWNRERRRERVLEIIQEVGLESDHLYRFPHEFSGGQRQRIAIARALVLNPKFLVLDEPTSALDVSVQAKILNLLKGLQKKLGLTYMFISHNLSVVRHMSNRIAVMYLGKIMETAYTQNLFKEPLHQYTKMLFSSIPIPDPHLRGKERISLGEVPSPVNPPLGCRFHPRCVRAEEVCKRAEPKLIDVGKGHLVACHLV